MTYHIGHLGYTLRCCARQSEWRRWPEWREEGGLDELASFQGRGWMGRTTSEGRQVRVLPCHVVHADGAFKHVEWMEDVSLKVKEVLWMEAERTVQWVSSQMRPAAARCLVPPRPPPRQPQSRPYHHLLRQPTMNTPQLVNPSSSSSSKITLPPISSFSTYVPEPTPSLSTGTDPTSPSSTSSHAAKRQRSTASPSELDELEELKPVIKKSSPSSTTSECFSFGRGVFLWPAD